MTRFGCKRSPKDGRDWKYRTLLAARAPAVLPERVDYTRAMTAVRNQFTEGSCVGFACAAMKEFQEGPVWWLWPRNLSERYIYNYAKTIDGEPLPHEGTTIRAAMEILLKHGVPPERCWPYIANVDLKPCRRAESHARGNRIKSYMAIDSVLEMKQALVTNGPFVVGIDVYTSFDNAVDGVIPMPSPGERRLGGHAICIVGYDNGHHAFRFKNSWGCYDKETEVLTKIGWKYFKDLTNDDNILTLNSENKIEFENISDIIRYEYNGLMYHYKSRDVDLMVTPNHKLYIKRTKGKKWRLEEAQQIDVAGFEMKKDGIWSVAEIQNYKVGNKIISMDLWLEFLGYFISEGYTTHAFKFRKARIRKRTKRTGHKTISYVSHETGYKQHSYIVGICQNPGSKSDKIQTCIDKLPWKFHHTKRTWVTNNKDIFSELKGLGKAKTKYLPDYSKNLPPRQLKILLEALMLGDGSGSPLHKWTYYTSSKKLSDDIQEIVLKIGYAGDVTTIHRYDNPEYAVGIKTKEMTPIKQWKPEKTQYNDVVYCVEVPNHIIYVRRNGKAVWSGNSSWGDGGYGWLCYEYVERHAYDGWLAADLPG